MKNKAKIILLCLSLLSFILSLATLGVIIASAEEPETPQVQFFVDSPENIVPSGTVTNKKFGIQTKSTGYAYLRFPNQNTEMRYVNSSLLLNYSQNGIYTVYLFRSEEDSSISIELNLQITLDTVSPIISVFENSNFTTEEFISGNLQATVSDNISGIKSFEVSASNSEYVPYSNEVFLQDARYEFLAIDNAGNKSRITITKDSILPIIEVYGGEILLENNALTNVSSIEIKAIDELSGIKNLYIKQPNAISFTKYTQSAISFSQSGQYVIYTNDMTGNVSETFVVTVDNILPLVSVSHGGKLLSNNTCIKDGFITLHIDDPTAIGYVYRYSTKIISEVLSGASFTDEDCYLLYAIDAAGNKSQEVAITIDKIPKPVTIENVVNGMATQDVILSWQDILGNAPITKVTVNGVSVENNSIIKTINVGRYEVKSLDASGNSWSTVFAAARTDIETVTINKFWWEAKDGNGKAYAYETYENAHAFSAQRERDIVKTKQWTGATWDTGYIMDSVDSANAKQGNFYLYKKHDNEKTEVAYFTPARLSQIINQYAERDISKHYYWEKAPAQSYENNNLYAPFESGKIIATSLELKADYSYKIDGVNFSETSYQVAGKHILTVLDDYGNSFDYDFFIVSAAPEIEFKFNEGNYYTANTTFPYFLKNGITIKLADPLDNYAMALVRNAKNEVICTLNITEEFNITESGKYTIQTINHGGTAEYVFYVSLETPTVIITEDTQNKRFEVCLKPSLDADVNLLDIKIYRSSDDVDWVLLTEDDYGLAVNIENLSYGFYKSGYYKVIVEDTCRSGIDAIVIEKYFHVEIDEAAPTAELIGVANGGKTKSEVKLINPSEPAEIKAYLNGVEFDYSLGDTLTEVGVYRLILTDSAGNITEYTFEIIYSVNAAGTVFIIILIIALITGAVVVIIMRKRLKFKKKT